MATPRVIACVRACRRRENVHLGFLFRGFNFRGSPLNRENRENWLPRKYPAVRYTQQYQYYSITVLLMYYYSITVQVTLMYIEGFFFIAAKYQIVSLHLR